MGDEDAADLPVADQSTPETVPGKVLLACAKRKLINEVGVEDIRGIRSGRPLTPAQSPRT